MSLRPISYFLVFLAGLSLQVNAGKIALDPQTNPHRFREELHPDFAASAGRNPIVIPSVAEEDSPLFAKGANFDDALISESVGPANFTQNNADAASLKGGRTAFVWEDDRLGPFAIFLQIYNRTGSALQANRALIIGDGYNVTDPRITPDTSGNFYLVWREEVNGLLQAARFDSAGSVLTGVFFVSDTIFVTYAGEFDAACLPDGKLIVAWESYSLGSEIAYRVFNTNGSPAIPQMTANSDGPAVQHWSPAVVVDGDGYFGIAWEDYRNDVADIFFRRFAANGTPGAVEFSLSDATARDSARYLPAATFSPIDGYIITWVDLRDGENIYFQRLSTIGTPVNANVLVSDETSLSSNWEVDVTVNAFGNFIVAWTEYAEVNAIRLQRYSSGAQPNGSVLIVSEGIEKPRFSPTVTGNDIGNIAIAWTDLRFGSVDIQGAFLSPEGTPLRANFAVHDDAIGAPSIEPAAASYGRFEWEIVFTDMRRDAGDIMLQRIYVGGTLLGTNRRINADPPGGFQSQPAIASDNEALCISWTDVRSDHISGQNIFCRFSQPGGDLTDEMVVNDDYGGQAAHYRSECAINPLGITIIVWVDTRGGNGKIYGQLYNNSFDRIGNNFLVGPSEPSRTGELPAVTVDPNGNFVVAYLNRLTTGGPAIDVKRVNTAGAVDHLFSFQSDQSGYQLDGFDAAVNHLGLIYLIWHGFSVEGNGLFMTLFNSAGTITTPTQAVTDQVDTDPGFPSADIDSLDYLSVTWLDGRTGLKTPFRQIYEPSLTPIQANTPAHASAAPFMQSPATSANRGRTVYVWSDARANGLNVYAAQVLYEPTAIGDDNPAIPTAYALEQNFPNPFNPSTSVQFTLPQAGRVRLEIINLLGQRVRLLADQSYPAGTHNIIWDGSTDSGDMAATGVYLYRMTAADFAQARKMILLK